MRLGSVVSSVVFALVPVMCGLACGIDDNPRLLATKPKPPIARFTLGEYLMFGALLFVVVSLVVPTNSAQITYVLVGFWIMFLAVFVDVFILSRQLRKRLMAKFGEVERGSVWYGCMRALQFRKLRLPKPQVKRGQYPS